MTTTHKTYTLGSMKQLIDLNGDITNFDLTFTVTSVNGSEFDVIVVDQTTLDNNPNLDYKKAKGGTISGNILSDKGVYQNYFLLLKSGVPLEVNVDINIKEVPQNTSQELNPPPINPPQKSSTINWNLVIVSVAIIGLSALYFYFSRKTEPYTNINSKAIETNLPTPVAPVINNSSPQNIRVPTPHYTMPISSVNQYSPKMFTPSPKPYIPQSQSQSQSQSRPNQSLIDRFNSLPLKK
jgi:hypothetical protein